MDIQEIRHKAIIFYLRCRDELGIRLDGILLFGSYARKEQRRGSDIDLAVLSQSFGKDRFKEGSMLNVLAHEIDSRFEVIPVNTKEYCDQPSISPIIFEIQKKHIWLF